MVAHSMHQVGLAQTHAAIKEQRVVAVLGIVRHLPGGSARQLVGFTFDKVLEGEGAIKITGVLEPAFALHVTFCTRGSRRFGYCGRDIVIPYRFLNRRRCSRSRLLRTCRGSRSEEHTSELQ